MRSYIFEEIIKPSKEKGEILKIVRMLIEYCSYQAREIVQKDVTNNDYDLYICSCTINQG